MSSDKRDIQTIVPVVIEVIATLEVGELVAILEKNGAPTPEDCGVSNNDVEWRWEHGFDFPTWSVRTVENQTEVVKGLGSE